MNIGINLKEIREKNNLSISDLAKVLSVAKITYNHYETQEKIIPIERLNDICNYYNISIDYVLGLSNCSRYENSNSEIMQDLSAKRIKEFRKEKNITQAKLASLVGTVQSTFTKYEKGINLIPTSFLCDICKKYRISADYLLGKIDEPKYLN